MKFRSRREKFAAFSLATMGVFTTTAAMTPIHGMLTLISTVIASFLIAIYLARIYATHYAPRLVAKDKVIFITGCDTGLGHYTAIRLRQMGFKVYATCLNSESEGADILKRNNCIVYQVDYLDKESIRTCVNSVTDDNSVIWGVIANAGVTNYGEFEWMTPDEFEWVIQVNVLGTLYLVRSMLPAIIKGNSRLIIVGGTMGRISIPGTITTCASTAALHSLADTLRREAHKHGVTAISVEPFLFRTRMTDDANIKATLTDITQRLPAKKQAEFGQDYLNKFIRVFCARFRQLASLDAHIFVAQIAHALLNRRPLCRFDILTPRQYLIYAAVSLLPFEMQDFAVVTYFTPVLTPVKGVVKDGALIKAKPEHLTGRAGSAVKIIHRSLRKRNYISAMPVTHRVSTTPKEISTPSAHHTTPQLEPEHEPDQKQQTEHDEQQPEPEKIIEKKSFTRFLPCCVNPCIAKQKSTSESKTISAEKNKTLPESASPKKTSLRDSPVALSNQSNNIPEASPGKTDTDAMDLQKEPINQNLNK